MRRLLPGRLFLGSCLVLGLLAVAVQAQHEARPPAEREPGHGAAPADHKHAAAPKYEALVHHDGHEDERTFDLSNPKDAEELMALLREGHVDELKQAEKPVNILEIKWDLGLWTLVVFLLLLLILKKVAWGPMLEGLKKREESIRTAVEEAKRVREDAARDRAAFQKQLDEAQQEIPRLMEEARRDAAALKEEMRTQAQAEIQSERQRLRREIDMARDQALQELWSQSARLATLISSKIIKRELKVDDQKRLVDESLEEIQQGNAGWKARSIY